MIREYILNTVFSNLSLYNNNKINNNKNKKPLKWTHLFASIEARSL